MRRAARLSRRGLSTASASSSHHFVRAARYGLPLAGLGGAALYLSDDERRDRLRSSIFNHDAVFAQESPLIMDETTTRTELRRRYRFEKQLGVGAFGEVWLAVDSASGERVAIKLLSLTEATEPPALQLALPSLPAAAQKPTSRTSAQTGSWRSFYRPSYPPCSPSRGFCLG